MGVTSVSIQSKCMYRAADLRRSQEGGATEKQFNGNLRMCGDRKRVAACRCQITLRTETRGTEIEEATKTSMTADEP